MRPAISARIPRLAVVHDIGPHASLRRFPIAAGVLFGLALGGLVDSIVLRALLHWHPMLDVARVPALAPLWDSAADTLACALVAIGLGVLWRREREGTMRIVPRVLAATMLVGFGAYVAGEALAAQALLAMRDAGAAAPSLQWIARDAELLLVGVAAVLAGFASMRGRRRAA